MPGVREVRKGHSKSTLARGSAVFFGGFARIVRLSRVAGFLRLCERTNDGDLCVSSVCRTINLARFESFSVGINPVMGRIFSV